MPIELAIDNYALDEFCALLQAEDTTDALQYVVTPNVDHIIRYCDEPDFRRFYQGASYVLLDSRFLAKLLRWARKWPKPPQACPGSDLTATIFLRLLRPQDRVLLIGGSEIQAAVLRDRFGLADFHHFNPPMGFIRDAEATETCLKWIERLGPFRFCFVAVGSPQQEQLAFMLKQRNHARGIVLCVGASINFLTGTERRAPLWMQHLGVEWLFRLLQSPRRLAHRYLLRGPRIFWLLSRMQLRMRQMAS